MHIGVTHNKLDEVLEKNGLRPLKAKLTPMIKKINIKKEALEASNEVCATLVEESLPPAQPSDETNLSLPDDNSDHHTDEESHSTDASMYVEASLSSSGLNGNFE